MDRELEMLLGMLDALTGDGGKTPPTDDKKDNEELKTTSDGFKSFVSDEEFKAILDIRNAVDKYIDVHNKNTLERLDSMVKKTKENQYARVQYTILSSMVDDLLKALSSMVHIHHFDKEFMDSICGDMNCSLDEFEKKMMISGLIDKFRR